MRETLHDERLRLEVDVQFADADTCPLTAATSTVTEFIFEFGVVRIEPHVGSGDVLIIVDSFVLDIGECRSRARCRNYSLQF